MKDTLTKRAGPLPVWGWIAITGVGLGAFLLWRKAKQSKAAEEGSLPIPSTFGANPPEGGVGSAGGGGGEVKSPEAQPRLEVVHEPGANTYVPNTPVGDVLAELAEIEAAGFHRGPTGSQAGSVDASHKASHGGPPRPAAAKPRAGTYHGHAAHIYPRAVKGGVGPGKNIVVLNPSHGQKSHQKHSKTPDHSHAHVKGSTTHHKPGARKAPVRHAHKPPTRRKRR